MATAALLPLPRAVFYDANGNCLAGGLVHTYVAGGGTTPKTTWQDAGETTPNANPVVLDAAGSAPIYGAGDYAFAVTDALGNAIPGYSGTTTGLAVSSALAAVLAASTVTAAFNLLAAGGGTVGSPLDVSGNAATNRDVTFQTGTSARWSLRTGSIAESGSNAGSNFQVVRYTDGGAQIDVPLTINRATASLTYAVPGVFDNTAMHDGASFMVNGASSTTEFQWSHPGNFSTEALACGINVPSSSTAYAANAFGAYVNNGWAGTAGATAGYFYARNSIVGGKVYALNALVTDQTNVGTAGLASTVVGAEFDIGAFNTSSVALGINMIGVFPNGTPSNSSAYQVSAIDPAGWEVGFNIGDAAAVVALNIGSATTAANSDGIPINLSARDGSNVERLCAILAQHNPTGANLLLQTPTGGVTCSASFSAVGVANFSAGIVVAAAAGALAGFSSGGTGVGSITTNGTTTAYNTTSDHRLKEITGTTDGSLIDSIPTHLGHYINHPDQTQTLILAHEAQAVMPWAVTGEKDATDGEGKPIYQMIDYSMLVPELVAKCQALEKRLAAIEAKAAA